MKKREKQAAMRTAKAPRPFMSFVDAHLACMASVLGLPPSALATPVPYLRALSPACMTTRHVVVRKGSAIGKTTALIFHTSGPFHSLRADLGDRRFWYIDPRKAGGQPGVTVSQHPHPPVGTPRDEALRGNSPPTLAPVAGRADWLNPVVGG